MSFKIRRGGQLAFRTANHIIVNSGNKILFPKTFCNLNFQLKYPNRSICISLSNTQALTGGFRVFIAKTNAREIPKIKLITCNAKTRCSLGRDNRYE